MNDVQNNIIGTLEEHDGELDAEALISKTITRMAGHLVRPTVSEARMNLLALISDGCVIWGEGSLVNLKTHTDTLKKLQADRKTLAKAFKIAEAMNGLPMSEQRRFAHQGKDILEKARGILRDLKI